jgi:hypothetical protein
MERDRSLEEARARLEGLARGLTVRFGPEETARLFGGTLLGLTVGAAGRVAACEFLEGLVAQLQSDHPENWGPPDANGEAL